MTWVWRCRLQCVLWCSAVGKLEHDHVMGIRTPLCSAFSLPLPACHLSLVAPGCDPDQCAGSRTLWQ
jgi:hypothetical protein